MSGAFEVIPYVAILAAVVLPYWPRHLATAEMAKLPGGYNNKDPRAQQAQLKGYGKRALNAHLNGLEALPMFGISVLAAMQRSVAPPIVSGLCVAFIAVRIAHVIVYLRDADKLRGPLFLVGWIVCMALLVFAAFGHI